MSPEMPATQPGQATPPPIPTGQPQAGLMGLAPGQTISKYNVTEMIGQGGSAVVWKAVDPVVNRFVAIKHLTTQGLSAQDQETLKEAFHTETRMIKMLGDHPHLVQILEFIDEPRGLFIIMEFVEGASLEQVLTAQPGPLPEREALGMVAAAATALQHIHGQNIIHRDLKPGNLLIPQGGGLKICDFGLSTLTAEQEQMDLGTVRYMAPECFSGNPTDARADIYSLGLITYEMLAGRAKFEEVFKMVLRDERHQAMRWMKWHTNARTTAPALNTINPAISQGLSDIVARMMEKDPQQRFGSSPELLEAFKRYFSGEMNTAQLDPSQAAMQAAGTANATAAITKKSKLPMILAAVNLVLLIGVAVYFINDDMKKQDAIKEQQDAHKNKFLAAKKLMDDKQWADAQDAFFEFKEDPKYQSSAELGMVWSQANLDNDAQLKKHLLKRDFSGVIENAESVIANPKLGPNLKIEVQRLLREAQRTSSVIVQFNKIKAAIDGEKYNIAKYLIYQIRKLKDNFNDEEQLVLEQITGGIDLSQYEAIIREALTQAENLFNAGKYSQAIARIDQTVEEYGEHDGLLKLKQKVNEQIEYDNTVAKARKAENNGELRSAVTFYQQADRMRNQTQFASTVKSLRTKIALDDGLAAERSNNFPKARQLLARVLELDPNNSTAKAALKRMSTAENWVAMVNRGKSAFQSKSWQEAIEILNQAKAVKSNGEINSMIQESKDRIDLAKAYELAKQEKLDESIAILERLQSYPEASGLLAKVKVLNRAKRLISQAMLDLKRGDHPGAKRVLADAMKITGIPNGLKEQIKALMHEVEYEDLLDKAKKALAIESEVQLQVANGHAQAAYRIRRKYPEKGQKEIIALVDEIDRKIKALKKSKEQN